jgi:hypothetical protein
MVSELFCMVLFQWFILIKEVNLMKRLVALMLILLISLANDFHVHAEDEKAAFVRNDGLWYKDGDVEWMVAEGSNITYPKISSDGIYISYLYGDEDELWVYNRVTRLKRRVFTSNAANPMWSPNSPILAWVSNGVLDMIDVSNPNSSFQNVLLGVGNYSWAPDGKNFIVSSSSNLEPDGWTPVKIFTVPYNADGNLKKVKLLTVLPKASQTFFAIGTTKFKWSARGKMFAFIACPTASLSADSNTLMVVSRDGSSTKMVGEMLSDPNWFHWSPKTERLGFINGIGRLTTENKKLSIWEADSGKVQELGAAGYADGEFTWRDDKEIVVSRQQESGWNIPQENRPKPFLVSVNTKDGISEQVTKPGLGRADVYPKSLPDHDLVWVRTNTIGNQAKVMKKSGAQSKERIWIEHLKAPSECYGWQCVLDIYKAR